MAKGTSGNIAIIGKGHMGTALLQGLIKSGISRSRIFVSDTVQNNARAVRNARVIFIAVKPGVVGGVLRALAPHLGRKLVVSLAAGIAMRSMKRQLKNSEVARIMPNIPVAYGEGVVGIYARGVSAKHGHKLRALLKGLGLLIEVKNEHELDALTLLSGCGPAIVATFLSIYERRARALGISDTALALQVFKGTLAHLDSSGMSAAELSKSVATKGGVTEAILKQLKKEGFEQSFERAVERGKKKLRTMRA